MMRTSARTGPRRADPLERPVLQHAQELGLHVDAELADLVEEQRAAVRRLEPAGARRDGAGERAFLVAEQLALDQGGGNGRAVDAHERAAAPRAALVQRAREQLLAGAGFAEQQHRRVGRRHLRHPREHLADGAALADDVVEVVQSTALPRAATRSLPAAGRAARGSRRGARPALRRGACGRRRWPGSRR